MVAQQFDFGAIAVEPTGPAMREFNRVFEGVFRGDGRNMGAGRQLPAQFEERRGWALLMTSAACTSAIGDGQHVHWRL